MSTSPEQAYDLGDVPNARAVGMGGALNALGVSTASLFLNPANMPLARVYHLEALAAYSPEAKRQTYGPAIVDSVLNSSHVAGGLGGTWNEFDPTAFTGPGPTSGPGSPFPSGTTCRSARRSAGSASTRTSGRARSGPAAPRTAEPARSSTPSRSTPARP